MQNQWQSTHYNLTTESAETMMNFGVNVTMSLMMDSAQKMSTVNIKLGIEVNGRINMAFEKEKKKYEIRNLGQFISRCLFQKR